MAKGQYYILTLLFILLCLKSKGQKVFFTGLGRALITNEELNGKVLDHDSLTPNRSTDGYVLFDMGVNFRPYDYLKGKAVVRLKNKFGVFFGQGASVEFRQVLLEGLIAHKLRYSIGDIDVLMTPYTVYNNPDNYHEFEGEVFRLRREIVYYENFNVGNYWRVQGAKANANILVRNTASKILLNGFVSRTRPTNYYSLPDRFLVGASAISNLDSILYFGANYVRFFDLKNQTGASIYKNDVLSSSLRLKGHLRNVSIQLMGEGGYSLYRNYPTRDSGKSVTDKFYDISGEVKIYPYNIVVTGGYKYTGTWFYSPAAQTLRIDATSSPLLFPTILNNRISREQLLYDRLTQENIYNQTIRSSIMTFLPQYGNVLPYGLATPNRQGAYARVRAGDRSRIIFSDFQTYWLKEIRTNNSSDRRNFLLLQCGLSFQLHRLLHSSRSHFITGGIKVENTNRTNENPVSLASRQWDVGVQLETFRNLDLIAGCKLLYARGNEFIEQKDAFNETTSFVPLSLNQKQQIASVGIKYRFSERSFFAFTGNFVYHYPIDHEELNYNIHQYFITYSVVF